MSNRSSRDRTPELRPPELAAPAIKLALFTGFALIAGIWLFAGYYFTGRMADLEHHSNAINARYMRAQDLLTETRGQILLGSVYLRDALLDPDPSSAENYRKQLEASSDAAEAALRQYVPILDTAEEKERIARLQREVDDFRRMLLRVLQNDNHEWRTEARAILRGQIMPKREGVLRISEQVQALNRSAFVQQQREIVAVYGVTQRHVWQSFGLAVAASFGIALLATLYASRLERRIQRQRIKDAETARDLQRLSSQLLTAQETERRTIARELHDEVGQVLTAIKVELSLAEHAITASGGPPNALEEARTITDGALRAVRDLSLLLHPALLDDLGLPAAIAWYIKGFTKRHAVQVDFVHEHMEDRLAPAIESTVYRIIQEALTNVARHAQAQSCRIQVERQVNSLFVTIEDDGTGFDPATLSERGSGRGLGLISMRERATQLDGRFRLETANGKGTRLSIVLPIVAGEVAEPDVLVDGATAVAPAPTVREVFGG